MVVRVKVGVGSSLGLWEGWVVVRVKVGVGSSSGLWEGWVVVRVKVGVGSSLGLYGRGGWWLESRLGLDHL